MQCQMQDVKITALEIDFVDISGNQDRRLVGTHYASDVTDASFASSHSHLSLLCLCRAPRYLFRRSFNCLG